MKEIRHFIDDFKSGLRFRKITLGDLYGLSHNTNEIIKMGNLYNVKPEKFGTSEERVRNYLNVFWRSEDYYELKRKVTNDGEIVGLSIFVIPAILFTIILCFSYVCLRDDFQQLMIFILTIASVFLIKQKIFPYLISVRKKRLIEKHMKEHNLVRQDEEENYINEVLFQLYVHNRDAVLETKYILLPGELI